MMIKATTADNLKFTYDSISCYKLTLKHFEENPILIVITASRCGFKQSHDGCNVFMKPTKIEA